MKKTFLIAVLSLVMAGTAIAEEEGRFRIVNTTVNIAGTDIPIALMFDSETGASWYLALAQTATGDQQIPTWQEILYFPNLTPTPGPSRKTAN